MNPQAHLEGRPVLETDPGTCRVLEAKGPLSRFALKLVDDPRNLILVRNAALASTIIPLAVSFYLWDFPWWLALPYWAFGGGVFADRVGLLIHAVIHRRLFKKSYWFLEYYIPAFLCLFYGHTPHTFFIHHVGMHHYESNMPEDLSSTMRFNRDSAFHFVRYWLRFLFIGPFELLAYQIRHKRWRLARLLILVEGAWAAGVIALAYYDLRATFVVFMAPVFVMRYAMMAGNWAQHAFVCSEQPGNMFRQSITLIEARHNRRCYNDGYHVTHHRFPTMHYSDHPKEFEANRALYGREGAVVFRGIKGYQEVWRLLMFKDYERLADHYVNLTDEPMDREAVIALLKSRTRAIPDYDGTPAFDPKPESSVGLVSAPA